MKLTILLLQVCSAMCMAASDYPARTYSFNYLNSRYECVLSNAVLRTTPAWEDEQLSPPYPPRKADQVARNYVNEFFPDSKSWIRRRISLSQVTKSNWIYEVVFIPAFEEITGPWPELTVVVLMNGEVIKYTRYDKQQKSLKEQKNKENSKSGDR